MNFTGQRDFSPYSEQYQRVVDYVLDIRVHYIDLYKVLLQSPQFEYEVESCRFRRRFARRYLSNLINLVRNYEHEKHLVQNSLFWSHTEHRDQLRTVNYIDN